MDIVDSVTQNSNNTTEPMENQGDFNGGYNLASGKTETLQLSWSFDDSDQNYIQNQDQHQEPNEPESQQMITADQDQPTKNQEPNQIKSAPKDNYIDVTRGKSSPFIPEYLRAVGMDPSKYWPIKYRFTREKAPGLYNPMTIAQRNFYENNGYLVMDHCVPVKLLDAIQSEYKKSSMVDGQLIDKLLTKNNRLLMYVKCFCDERVMLMTHQLVEAFQNKDSAKALMDNRQASRQQLFRDWIYLPFRPIDRIVCAITAIQELNHVLLVVPGTHKIGQCSISSTLENISAAYEASQESSQKSMARELYECAPENLSSLVEKSKKGFKYVNLKPGQTLFYHPGLIHGFSDDLINFGKQQLALIAYYAAADCEYVDLRKSNVSSALDKQQLPLPIGLAQFQGQNPTDYNSWIGRPRLITNDANKAHL